MQCYSTSLSCLHQLCSTMCFCLSDSEHDDGESWKLLKGVVPHLLVGVVPHLLVGVATHTGQHYWTSADTRNTANGVLCFTSAEHVVCYHDSLLYLAAVVVTQVAKLCHCASVHELLVGKESISSSFSSSPYIQALSTNTNSVTEHGPVKPAEPVELSNTSNNSVSVSKETSDENSQINQLFSRGHNTYSAVLPLKENNAPSSVGLNRPSYFEDGVLKNVLALADSMQCFTSSCVLS